MDILLRNLNASCRSSSDRSLLMLWDSGWSLGILTRFSIPVKRVEGTFNPMPALWFRDTLEDCSLMDLGSSGPHFTWRGQEFTGYEQVVFKRLDRAVCNASWRSAFPEEAVRVLPCFKSGHHALLLDISGFRPDQRVQRPFRYLAAWHTHSNFPRMLQSSWQSSLSFAMNPVSFRDNVQQWNREVFGNIQIRIEG
ncbi:uncharacterized protein LOC116188792 [Punica granatum]|uniref:Uncharacterized protein LOC116188792 n=1 Tax=Punica granatum TaxID=22663 RepID=A0A6P8BTC6_PUNGR|nr:uncharacterized protein LOC116188792 [Punica granatum]